MSLKNSLIIGFLGAAAMGCFWAGSALSGCSTKQEPKHHHPTGSHFQYTGERTTNETRIITTTNTTYNIGPITFNPPPNLGPYEDFLKDCDQRYSIHETGNVVCGNKRSGVLKREIDARRVGIKELAIKHYLLTIEKRPDGTNMYDVPMIDSSTGEKIRVLFKDRASLERSVDPSSEELIFIKPENLEGILEILK